MQPEDELVSEVDSDKEVSVSEEESSLELSKDELVLEEDLIYETLYSISVSKQVSEAGSRDAFEDGFEEDGPSRYNNEGLDKYVSTATMRNIDPNGINSKDRIAWQLHKGPVQHRGRFPRVILMSQVVETESQQGKRKQDSKK